MKKQRNNFSSNHKAFVRKIKLQSFAVHFSRIILLVFLLLVWELLATNGVIDPFLFSCPSRICKTLYSLFAESNLIYHAWVTLYETLLAFAISTIIGLVVAVLLYLIPFVRRILEPYLVILNSLPKIALGPLIIVWMGTGTKPIVAMGVLICVVITTMNMLGGFLQVEEDKIMLMKTMGANKISIFTKLIFPFNLSNLMSCLKINIGMAWVGVVMGEYLTSKAGLGYLIVYGGQVFKLDLVMSSIVVLCALAAIMYLIIALIEKYVNKKH